LVPKYLRFFELEADHDLRVMKRTQSLADITSRTVARMDALLRQQRPDVVVVQGDTTAVLAASLAAFYHQVPVAHVEAGLRSFDATMPEETNRRVTDLLSDLLFVTAPEGERNLAAEGITGPRVAFVGNPMIDTLLRHLERLQPGPVMARLGLASGYGVATLHRPANVDTPAAASALVAALGDATQRLPIVLPLHPRGRAMLTAAGLDEVEGLTVVEPLGYVEFLSLVRGAAVVITDSGGIQEETTVLDVPCLTLRPNTERPITISAGTNRLIAPQELGPALDAALAGAQARPGDGPPGWDGHAGERIAAVLIERARGGRRRA
jgi:UDP-N-acetylglucosamine 2-epimerase (non-hydrolysing)